MADVPQEVDLLVAGAGPAGMTAALVASLEGFDVLLCEKSQQVGGTGATSAGTLWIPGNTEGKAAGFADSAEAAEQYLNMLIARPIRRDLRTVFLRTGPRAIDYLTARTDVQFVSCGKHPDYRGNLPGAAVNGRAIVPKTFDGRLLGADFNRIRPPIAEYMLLGGMMVGKDDIPRLLGRFRSAANFVYAAEMFARYLADRLKYPRGTRLTMGNALIARLFYSLTKRGVPIRFGAALTELIGEPGAIRGARIRVGEREIVINTRKGVVLATGGFGRNEKFRAAFMPAPVPQDSLTHAGNVGDGIAIGLRAGGRVVPERGGRGGLWTPVSRTRRRDGSRGLYPHLSLDRAKPGLIAVNSAGCRFVNEAVSYHDFVEAMYEGHRLVPSIPAYLICDAPFVAKYGLGDIHPGTRDLRAYARDGYVVSGRTLDELAQKIGVSPVALRATIARHNGFARTGIDLDFGKGETELNRFNGDPDHGPNPCIGALATPPFHALAVWPAEIAVSTGLLTDADARVLDAEARPITGLYACGNDMASIMEGAYPGPGTTLGPATVFAYRAVMHACGKTG